MKKCLLNPAKTGLLIVSFLLVCGIASGATYTAVASGNWSSSATWGGTAPSFTITSADQVIIGTGIDVTMDQNVTLNNALAAISVTGTLSGAPYISLTVVSGGITGSGSITADYVMLNTTGTLLFTGSITADTLVDSIASLSLGAHLTVDNELSLTSPIDISTGGSLTMGANSTITLSGGSIALTGGTLNLNATYNVNYTSGSTTTGLELSGSGLGNITIDAGSLNNVTLGADLVTNDSLKFISGTLLLNGYSLTANGEISGNVMIGGNVASNLTINTTGGLTSSILFPPGFQRLDNLTINVGSVNSVTISSNLTVLGDLVISGSSNLNINGINLTIAGDMTGTGELLVNGSTSLAFTATNSITGNVNLTGTTLGSFLLNIGSDNTLMLGAGLNVDTLDLASGTLVLNGTNLSVNAAITGGGTGIISSTSASNITVNSSASVIGSLMFSASGDVINNLTVNIGGGGSLTVGSDLVINGTLHFMNGFVYVRSDTLSIGTSGSITGAGINAYVITGAGGYLNMYATIGNTTLFEVGDSTSFLPAAISLNTGSASGTIGVNVSPGVYSQGTSGIMISASQPMVDATWLFQNNIGAGINANMQLSWSTSVEANGFTHTGDYISHYSAGWDDIIGDTMTALFSGSLYSVTRANITSMSPFAVFDQQTFPTGINEITKGSGGFEIYPNPAHNDLYIKNSTENSDAIYAEIYNALGQVVSRFQFKDALFTVPVSGLATGNYFIKFYTNDIAVVKKFIKL